MKDKLKLAKRYVRRVLKVLYIEYDEERLPDNSGVVFRLKTGVWRGVIVNAYDTGTILVQGKGSTGELEVALIRALLEHVAAVVKADVT